MVVSFGTAKEAPSNGSVAHGRQMPHDDIEGEYGLVGYLSCPALKRLLQPIQRHLCHPLDRHPEQTILALAGQRDFEFLTRVSNGQRIASVQVVAAVKHRLQSITIYLRKIIILVKSFSTCKCNIHFVLYKLVYKARYV